jgi:hypothetical protein
MNIKHPYTGKKIKTRGYPITDPYFSLTLCPECGSILNIDGEKDCFGHFIYRGQDCQKCLWRNSYEE